MYFYTVWKEACIRVLWLSYSPGHIDHSLTLASDFSNLWKPCYRFTHASFHTGYNYTWITALTSVTVSLHYLPKCLCSTITCRAPIQWFQINLDFTPKKTYSYNKNPESLCYKQIHTSVLLCIETIIEYWFNYSSSFKFFFCSANIDIWMTFLLLKTFFITLVTYSVDIFHYLQEYVCY